MKESYSLFEKQQQQQEFLGIDIYFETLLKIRFVHSRIEQNFSSEFLRNNSTDLGLNCCIC